MADSRVRILCAIFFFSGAAALIFETLWFRQAGLAFGNSVWASSLVLSSFMAGLALGNGLTIRFGKHIHRPVILYAGIEVAIGATGAILVFIMPLLAYWLAPVLQPFLDSPWLLNPLRFSLAFLLLVIPTTAMGATLPLLVKALREFDSNFGSVLGRLYGLNTFGAVLGAICGELLLIPWLGVTGTALAATAIDFGAGLAALWLSRELSKWPTQNGAFDADGLTAHHSRLPWRFIAAAFFSGAILLALEVVWFRFLQLFLYPTNLAFALMLAVVLSGIGLGGFVTALWSRRDHDAFRHAPVVAFLSGTLTVIIYTLFFLVPRGYAGNVGHPVEVLRLAMPLIFPAAMLSGVLFTLTGMAVQRHLLVEVQATGVLTLANTTGAGLGSLLAGFILLPLVGMEISFYLLAALYGVVALLLWPAMTKGIEDTSIWPRRLTAACLFFALLFFPFGWMQERYLVQVARTYGYPERAKVVGMREGRTETILYLRSELFGEPISYRLVTNGFSMADNSVFARRYMKLFIYLPVALHTNPERALLISYGIGSTAKALTDTRSLKRIDVVDISQEILEMNELVYPLPTDYPLRDPRVHVYVEDGRYFLQTRDQRYDLITSEPPPPKHAGIVNLYTREYFQLIYNRLADGGINTYWLPMHNLMEEDAKGIIRAYCDVFQDCSLWRGFNLNWMLVGSRNAGFERSEKKFRAQWGDPVVARELQILGIEVPEQLGALFIAEASDLKEITQNVQPLVDNFPKRLQDQLPTLKYQAVKYAPWMDRTLVRTRFEHSNFIGRSWPKELRRGSIPYFDYQQRLEERVALSPVACVDSQRLYENLDAILTRTRLKTLALWYLNVTDDELRAADRAPKQSVPEATALAFSGYHAMAERQFHHAAEFLGRALSITHVRDLHYLRLYALCMAGRKSEAAHEARKARAWLAVGNEDPGFWRFMDRRFGLHIPRDN